MTRLGLARSLQTSFSQLLINIYVSIWASQKVACKTKQTNKKTEVEFLISRLI